MKKNLLLMASLFISGLMSAQEVNVSLGQGYANQVFYKFATNTQTPVVAASWDIAFQNVVGQQALGTIRVNDGRGIIAYQASATAADYATIDVTAQTGWTQLSNSDTEWVGGALDQGTAEYGWGNYNPVTHHVEGAIVYVLKYSATVYKKLFIEDYFGGFTFKYATWDGTAWSADTTATVANNSAFTTTFNFYSLDTNGVVTVAPVDADWDMVFTKYTTNLGTTEEPTPYVVTGTLHNSAAVTVAETDQTGTGAAVLPANAAYSTDINTIGYDWKTLNAGFTYDIPANKTFYLKSTTGNSIYKLYFTSFAGSSTGALSFNKQDVTGLLSLEDVTSNIAFSVYPNPSTDGNVTLMYDLKNNTSDKNTVSVYSLTGAKVFETQITSNAGFYTKDLNLSSLSAGIYILKLDAGSVTKTQKLVIK